MFSAKFITLAIAAAMATPLVSAESKCFEIKGSMAVYNDSTQLQTQGGWSVYDENNKQICNVTGYGSDRDFHKLCRSDLSYIPNDGGPFLDEAVSWWFRQPNETVVTYIPGENQPYYTTTLTEGHGWNCTDTPNGCNNHTTPGCVDVKCTGTTKLCTSTWT